VQPDYFRQERGDAA